ncbi:MAG: 2-C-methyl-D-erythritol 2,4-cyclodiphosphate synthase [Planctomycetota bacterium]|nr:2-C-methyl-D-erythritol 2,4-cyclodiphosphate synthase [Planctomycetota bacterium]
MRVGIGHDTHRLVEGRPLILAGVTIPHPRGLMGHSDADVVMHAVADALLGAAALGDIGEHFPDTDPRWKGIAGRDLLAQVYEMVRSRGWVAVNIDVTIHAQSPKLSPYKQTMAAHLAETLALNLSDVNVKAKTGEGVGPVGLGEIIGCDAAALIRANQFD